MENITTTDLGDFGHRERVMAEELLKAWREQGLPEDFSDDKVTLMMNTSSGHVFLVNEDFQVAMMNCDKLESFYNCPECGNEGFADDINWNAEKGLCGDCAPSDDDDDED